MKAHAKILYSALLCSSSLWATPQLVPTDSGLFEELNGLVNRNVIQLDLSTYPLSQAEIKRALNTATPQTQSDQLVIQRIRSLLQEKRDGFTVEAEAHSALRVYPNRNDQRFINFTNATDQYRTTLKQSFNLEEVDFYLQANHYTGKSAYRTKRNDLAGSYVALRAWNQILSVGMQQRRWGSGHSGNLILGEAARPFPSISLQREKQDPFKSEWLSWLGRWQYQAFIGKPLNFDGGRSPKDYKIIGMRFTTQPTNYLELGASRIMQWGGDGRIENFTSLKNAFFGNDNATDNVSTEQEPGNQIAGVDFRVRLMPLLGVPLSIYGQTVGEDEASKLPSQHSYLLGIDGSHNISHRQTLNWFIEGADTSTDFGRRFNTLYSHHLYADGYYHQKLPLGYHWGEDMRVLTIGVNSAYRNNDITALVKDHHWHGKLQIGKSLVPNLPTRHYHSIEIGWAGHIPIDNYISLKLNTSLWWLKQKTAEEKKSDLGVSSKASMEF